MMPLSHFLQHLKCHPSPPIQPKLQPQFYDQLMHRRAFHTSCTHQTTQTHYTTLGVALNADQRTIKQAFYTESKKHHPDIATGTPAKFAELQYAYETLANPLSRQTYDRSLSLGRSGGAAVGTTSSGRTSPGRPRPPKTVVLSTNVRRGLAMIMIVSTCIPVYYISSTMKNRIQSRGKMSQASLNVRRHQQQTSLAQPQSQPQLHPLSQSPLQSPPQSQPQPRPQTQTTATNAINSNTECTVK
eukprot:m.62204 g.62204  ORF g.62204 m.62204 type:complete len:243 (+) comp23107_c0_seq1:84-812(+)